MNKSTPYRIFAADDAPEIRSIIEHSLKKDGWVVRMFESGEELVEACKKSAPDIIISDVNMEGISGHAVCSWAKQNLKSQFVPVLLLTSQDTDKEKVLGLNNGAADYITKPFSPEELKARVQVALRAKSIANRLRHTQAQLDEKEKLVALMMKDSDMKKNLLQPLESMVEKIINLRESQPQTQAQAVLIADLEAMCMQLLSSIFEN